ncbi:MAG: OadG family protein [Bacteroidales bacterium]|nr:OadG family protein [Bacteroidales bacterium]
MRKKIFITLVAIAFLAWGGKAQAPRGNKAPLEATAAAMSETAASKDQPSMCMMGYEGSSLNMQRNTVALLHSEDGDKFVIIDSIDNCIDMVLRTQDTLLRVGHYRVDNVLGRHDVANILRPQSIKAKGNHIFFCASALNDLGKVGVLTVTKDSVVADQVIDLPCHAQFIDVIGHELIVVGTNMQGYNINIFNIEENEQGLKLTPLQSNFYHVTKQSERIQASDPVGVGITVVAICVVFLALVLIAFIIGGNAKTIKWSQNSRARRAAIKAGKPVETIQKPADTTGEVFAAIAAAIYLYQEDLHDEEHAILTINKVERAWTPWNAKFFNMNQYFNTRTRTKK